MCKILCVAGIKPENSENAWKFVKAMAKPMSRANNDGLGYAAITADGQLFGERWLKNSDAFSEEVSSELDDQLFDSFGDIIQGDKPSKQMGEYNSFGTLDRNSAVALTLHTRMATAPKGMENTHPFVDEGASLIHNGIIRNADDIGLKSSTCDSESILRLYLKHDVKLDPASFQTCADTMQGYYACGVLTDTETGPILDVFKGNNNNLYVTKIAELATYVFSTSDFDIKEVCKDLGFTHGEIMRVKDGKFLRVDAVTCKTLSVTDFKVGASYATYSNSNYYGQGYTTTQRGSPVVQETKVYPFQKNRKNTEVSDELMEYFSSGKATCERLSERDTQEFIMNEEKMFGVY